MRRETLAACFTITRFSEGNLKEKQYAEVKQLFAPTCCGPVNYPVASLLYNLTMRGQSGPDKLSVSALQKIMHIYILFHQL